MSGNMFDLDVQVSKVNDMVEPNTFTIMPLTFSKCYPIVVADKHRL